jgi:23S rRNA (uracil1939-C5)-methyltransferase
MKLTKVTIESLDNEFKGITHLGHDEVVVGKVLPGETCEACFEKQKWGMSVKNLKVVTPSSIRQKVTCPIYDSCGGCQLLHVQYNEQLKLKKKKVEQLLEKTFQRKFIVQDTIGMEKPSFYRNKSQLAFKNEKGLLKAGVYVENSHEVLEAPGCILQDPICDKIVEVIKDLMKKMRLYAYDEDRKTGFFRHVLIKSSLTTKQVMVVLVTSNSIFPGKQNFIKALISRVKEITTIVQNVNTRQTSAVLGDKEEILFGKGYIEDVLLGKTFKISAHSFYQINPTQCAKLYRTTIDSLKLSKEDVLLDAYCGVGTIGIVASDDVKKVIGVELVKDAINDAIVNAKKNNVKNIHFYCDDASNFMVNMANKKEHVDCVIMDPPRKGSDEKFLSSLVKLSPKKIGYISCNPETQMDDLKYLLKNNYEITKIQPVDMFPHTSHVESCVLLERR